jgi:hypothetical protein
LKILGRNLYNNSITQSNVHVTVAFKYFEELQQRFEKTMESNKEEEILKNLIAKNLIEQDKKKLLLPDLKKALTLIKQKKMYNSKETPKNKVDYIKLFLVIVKSVDFNKT